MSLENNLECPHAGEKDGDHKIYLKEPSPARGVHESYFLAIRVGSGKQPEDYITAKDAQIIPVGTSAEDPDDQPSISSWNWYVVYCPQGPPCKDLYEEFEAVRKW